MKYLHYSILTFILLCIWVTPAFSFPSETQINEASQKSIINDTMDPAEIIFLQMLNQKRQEKGLTKLTLVKELNAASYLLALNEKNFYNGTCQQCWYSTFNAFGILSQIQVSSVKPTSSWLPYDGDSYVIADEIMYSFKVNKMEDLLYQDDKFIGVAKAPHASFVMYTSKECHLLDNIPCVISSHNEESQQIPVNPLEEPNNENKPNPVTPPKKPPLKLIIQPRSQKIKTVARSKNLNISLPVYDKKIKVTNRITISPFIARKLGIKVPRVRRNGKLVYVSSVTIARGTVVSKKSGRILSKTKLTFRAQQALKKTKMRSIPYTTHITFSKNNKSVKMTKKFALRK